MRTSEAGEHVGRLRLRVALLSFAPLLALGALACTTPEGPQVDAASVSATPDATSTPCVPSDLNDERPVDIVLVGDDSVSAADLQEEIIAVASEIVRWAKPRDRVTAFWMNERSAWFAATAPSPGPAFPEIPAEPLPRPTVGPAQEPRVGESDERVAQLRAIQLAQANWDDAQQRYGRALELRCSAEERFERTLQEWRNEQIALVDDADATPANQSPVIEAIDRGVAAFSSNEEYMKVLVVSGDIEPFSVTKNDLSAAGLRGIHVVLAPFRPDERGWESAVSLLDELFRGAGAASVTFVSADRAVSDVVDELDHLRRSQSE